MEHEILWSKLKSKIIFGIISCPIFLLLATMLHIEVYFPFKHELQLKLKNTKDYNYFITYKPI